MAATTMTATGEVTIPESVRSAAGLTPGAPLDVNATVGGVLIQEYKQRQPLDPNRFDKIRGPSNFPWRSTDEFMAFVRGDDV